MANDKIQFPCIHCQKTLAVAAQHAGKTIACPGCKEKMQVPSTQPPLLHPTPQSHRTPRSDDSLGPKRSLSERSVTPNHFAGPPSTGDLVGSDNLPPTSPSPQLSSSSTANVASGGSSQPDVPRSQATDLQTASTTGSPSAGRSVAGLVVASIVAMVCTAVWLLVVAFSGYELGILAWGIGGVIGLVAGAIGRNPSPVYCGLAAGIAGMSFVGAKLIMATAIMLLSVGADFMETFANFTPEAMKQSHAMADQMLVDGEFEGAEKEYANYYVTTYFSDTDDEELSEGAYQVSEQVEERIQSELEPKTPTEREQLIAAARERHPEWIEDNNLYLAVVDQMLNDSKSLGDDLAAQAKSELASLDGSWDEAYYESNAPEELSRRRAELRKQAAQQIRSMSELERDQAICATLGRYPEWDPFPNAKTAMMEKMANEGKFAGGLSEHALATLESELNDEYSDYFETVSDEEYDQREVQLQQAVGKELALMDQASREALVADTRGRHPDWLGQEIDAELAQQELEEAMDELGTDGSFLGSIQAVCGLFDLLWLFLGASTAFSTAAKFGEE
ncbi:hypothetical protein CA13_39050 [Planctomycetes bacterium CA13]|uniref:Uncharacterized protein n=1 Tax=Novipirellula herctigrandis TaxID=2527986 RepID=A0A5C5Z540_9BACT|nr:hypothetical protein CA13_39050 [Planctomycetes bacterium CA13]